MEVGVTKGRQAGPVDKRRRPLHVSLHRNPPHIPGSHPLEGPLTSAWKPSTRMATSRLKST